jgi:hypothetical protein
LNIKTLTLNTLVACSIATLAACSSSSDSTAPAPATSTSISGSIFAAPVNGADVSVENTSGDVVAGPVQTNSDGSYTIDIPDSALSSDLVFKSTGGIFDDEATGASGVGTQAGALSAYINGSSLAAGSSVHVTPGSTIISNLRTQHGKTATEAQTAFFNAFAYNTDTSVEPVDVTDPSSFTADDASRHIGWRAAVFSQLAQDIELTADQQFDMFAALAQDLSHDELDGFDASGAVSIGSTGKSLPADILDQYIAAAGSFTTAATASYQVTYTPPMMNVHGKNKFTISVADSSGTPVSGLTNLSVMPVMYMVDRMHATPVGETINEVAGHPGDYEITVYYLMPSRMMDGTTMGTWDLKVMIGTESAHFYPNIDMAMMTNTVRVQLKGIDDTIIDMTGLEVGRTYNLFKDQLVTSSGPGTHDFDIFIAPIETMMSFPALKVPMTLQSGMGGTPLDVTSVTVEAEVNGTGGYNPASPNGDGTWSLNDITLNSGANTIDVRLIVNSETKTTNGLAVDPGVNDFATFTVTLP